MTNQVTFVCTSTRRTGEKVETGVYKPVHPALPLEAFGIIEQDGVYPIPYTLFASLYRLPKNHNGRTLTREQAAAKPDLTDLLGVDLTVSPHCVVKVTNKDNPDGFDLLVVKSNNPEIKRERTGTARNKHIISVLGAVQSAMRRWGKTPDDLLGLLFSDYSLRRKRIAESNQPIIYDFADVPLTMGDLEQFTFLIQTRWGKEAERLVYENVTYKV